MVVEGGGGNDGVGFSVSFSFWEGDIATYLMNHTIPGVTCIVDDDMNLAFAELCGFLDEFVEVCVVEHIAWDGEGFAAVLVDGVGDLFCFGCENSISIFLTIYMHHWRQMEACHLNVISFKAIKTTNQHRYRSRQL